MTFWVVQVRPRDVKCMQCLVMMDFGYGMLCMMSPHSLYSSVELEETDQLEETGLRMVYIKPHTRLPETGDQASRPEYWIHLVLVVPIRVRIKCEYSVDWKHSMSHIQGWRAGLPVRQKWDKRRWSVVTHTSMKAAGEGRFPSFLRTVPLAVICFCWHVLLSSPSQCVDCFWPQELLSVDTKETKLGEGNFPVPVLFPLCQQGLPLDVPADEVVVVTC